jgi:hypothetical protein
MFLWSPGSVPVRSVASIIFTNAISLRISLKREKIPCHVAVKSNDIHKLKKGLTLTVKYSDDKLPRIAVMNVFD